MDAQAGPTDAELGAIATVELPTPGSPADWPEYIDCTRAAFRAASALGTKQKLVRSVGRSHPFLLDGDSTSSLYTWKNAFAAKVLARRLTNCFASVACALDEATLRGRLTGVADALPLVPPCYRIVASETILKWDHRVPQMARFKLEEGDAAWVHAVYPAYPIMQEAILREAVRCKQTRVFCMLLGLAGTRAIVRSPVADVVFDELDTEAVVEGVAGAGTELAWNSLLENHRRRESRRAADPTVPPLHPAFYGMVLRICEDCDVSRPTDHREVMSILDVIAEMHSDGRIDARDADAARDRLFAIAARAGDRPAYRYLLDSSARTLGNRFAAAVIPFAAAARRGA